jgi:hypothetical protein
MNPKTKNIDIVNNKYNRSLSEEFKTRSPYTQQCIKFLIGTTPTSNVKNELVFTYTNDFSSASPNTQTNIKFWLGTK